ncbi:MAG: hypothetical protein QM733_01355 [Ilumatobacteraceae bacterium]
MPGEREHDGDDLQDQREVAGHAERVADARLAAPQVIGDVQRRRRTERDPGSPQRPFAVGHDPSPAACAEFEVLS